MKEYLEKQKDGTYRFYTAEPTANYIDGWIEIPEGAELLVEFSLNRSHFYKDSFKYTWLGNRWEKTVNSNANVYFWSSLPVLWRREKTVEYLDPSDWSLKVVGENIIPSGSWIKVPEGAEQLTKSGLELVFWKDDGKFSWHTENSTEWDDNIELDLTTLSAYGKEYIVWQRHTQPEELPFIDDEPEYKELDQIILENSEPVAIPESWKENRNASDIADAALKHIRERTVTYDQADGERSAAKTAKAFNAITGKDITESEVWLMLQLLKDVRQWSRDEYHVDSAEDCIAYAALKAESLEKSNGGNNQSS